MRVSRRGWMMGLAGVLAVLALLAYRELSWWHWHGDQQEIDRAVNQAINEPNGGDYARGADIIRNSSRPDAIKRYQVGQLAIDAFILGTPKRPREGAEQGLRMVEDFAGTDDRDAGAAVQYLRMLFERGGGTPPHAFPTDAVVADCWRAIEQHRAADPDRCVALRRARRPNIAAAAT